MTVRQGLGLIAVFSLSVATIVAIVFQDNITQFNLNPRTPYQTYTPPPAPAYDTRDSWVLWPSEQNTGAGDVFYIHSTTYSARQHWNGPLLTKTADSVLRTVAAPNEAGPFMPVGSVYGPRYRQATLFARFTHKYDGLAARELAYLDIVKAFTVFLSERQKDRPFIIVGYGQGGLHALGLLQHYLAKDDELQRHLAAAYVFNVSTPVSLFSGPLQDIPPCDNENGVRCLIAFIDLEKRFDEEARRYRKRALIWSENKRLISVEKEPLLCINPLTWSLNDPIATAEDHLGAASATGLRVDETPPAITKAVSASCEDGILNVSRPQQNFLQRKRWFGDQWRPQDFNLFYHDIARDAERRIANLQTILKEEANKVHPIEDVVDLIDSPIHKAPE